MKYCENCFAAFDSPRCPLCGGKKVREIEEEDYCFLTERSAAESEVLADVLRGNEIPCVTEPSGNGVRTAMALPLENRKLFVPWRCFSAAKSYLREIAEAEIREMARAMGIEKFTLLNYFDAADQVIAQQVEEILAGMGAAGRPEKESVHTGQ